MEPLRPLLQPQPRGFQHSFRVSPVVTDRRLPSSCATLWPWLRAPPETHVSPQFALSAELAPLSAELTAPSVPAAERVCGGRVAAADCQNRATRHELLLSASSAT